MTHQILLPWRSNSDIFDKEIRANISNGTFSRCYVKQNYSTTFFKFRAYTVIFPSVYSGLWAYFCSSLPCSVQLSLLHTLQGKCSHFSQAAAGHRHACAQLKFGLKVREQQPFPHHPCSDSVLLHPNIIRFWE